MNMIERRQAERRQGALESWRKLGRRLEDRKRHDNLRVDAWISRFHECRARVNSAEATRCPARPIKT
jgi:hypothetical protein